MESAQERSAGRVEWIEVNIRGELWEKDTSRSEKDVYKMVLRPAMMYGLLTKRQRWSNSLTFVSENLKDIKIFTGTDQNGQWVYQRDSSWWAVWKQS